MSCRKRDLDATRAFGVRLRAIRMARGITARRVAKALDVSPAHISQVEHGRCALRIADLRTLAEVLGCTLDDLVP